MGKTLGLIEVFGMTPAIMIADAMAKVAAVQLLSLDFSAGAGWVQVRIKGDVAAVQAAVSAGQAMGQKQHCLIAHTVIARAADQIQAALFPHPLKDEGSEMDSVTLLSVVNDEKECENENVPSGVDMLAETETPVEENTLSEHDEPLPNESNNADVTCNLCLDVRCARLKGEPRSTCIHHTLS